MMILSFYKKLQTRLIFIFVSFVIVILLISGWMLQWMIRQNLETELGHKLIAVAGAASVLFDEEEIGYLIQDTGPRTHIYLSDKLLHIKQVMGVERICFFDLAGKSLLDTDSDTKLGETYFHLRFFPNEMEAVSSGMTAHTVLFHSVDKRPVMSGYAPLLLSGNIVGGVSVDGNATFLGAVKSLQKRLFWVGFLGSILAIILGIIFAGTISRPVSQLAESSRQIGLGDYKKSITAQGGGEIGFLAQTMEEMRKNIIERENELKAMVAGIAHEIRNPIGGIELFAGLLDDETKSNQEAQTHVQKISNEVKYLKEIVNRFLEFARPKEPVKEPIQLQHIIDEVLSLLTDEIKKQNIQIVRTKNVDRSIVSADPNHLKQMILNLTQNAIQAVPNGGEIHFDTALSRNMVKIWISDTGTGIPVKLQSDIFKPFFTTQEKGTGLGLSIVCGLAEANGGLIQLLHSNSHGTKFEIQLEKQTARND
jgi:signal transduction histidine kinase